MDSQQVRRNGYWDMMNRNRKRRERSRFMCGILYGVVLSVLVFVLFWKFEWGPFSVSSRTEKIQEKAEVIGSCIEKYYQGDVSDEDLVNGAAKGMMSALEDPYSMYYTSEEYREVMKQIDGSYVGIGVMLQQENESTIRIKDVTEDGPAEKSGIQAGDRFMKLDGEDVTGMTVQDLASKIKVDENAGATFAITIEREKEDGTCEVLEKKVECQKVTVHSIEVNRFDSIGYIRIKGFDKETDEQFKTAMENMRNDSVEGIVFDVRDNGGGSLDTVVAMLDELLLEGMIITEKSKMEGTKEFRSTDENSYDKPMVVLINGNSASASEVFAGTLQARGAAKLVGTKSFGKGVVQSVFSLENLCGGGLRITTAEYFLPNGESIHMKGLKPDVEIEYDKPEGDHEAETDVQLKKALEVIRK